MADVFALCHAAPRAWLEDLLKAVSNQEWEERLTLPGAQTVGTPMPQVSPERKAFLEGASIAIQVLLGYSELEELIPSTSPLWEKLNEAWQEGTA